MEQLEKNGNVPLKGQRFVQIVFLKRLSSETSPEDMIIPICSASTFADIEKELLRANLGQWKILETCFGKMPYWRVPKDEYSPIGSTCQILYAVSHVEYILAVVRTSLYDYPIALDPARGATDLKSAINAADPLLLNKVNKPIISYSTREAIVEPRDAAASIKEQQTGESHSPTAFIITTDDRPNDYQFYWEPEPKLPALQILYVKCKNLLRNSYGLNSYAFQMSHVSGALLHAVVSLSTLLKEPGSTNDDTKPVENPASSKTPDRKLLEEQRRAPKMDGPHRVVALGVADNLKGFYNELLQIMKELEANEGHPVLTEGKGNKLEQRIGKVFSDLCGDHPGAVTIRDSHTEFERMKQLDASTPADVKQPAPGSDAEKPPGWLAQQARASQGLTVQTQP